MPEGRFAVSMSDANKIQENSGVSTSGTSHVVTLGSGTTAGNTLIVTTFCGTNFSVTPTGFTLDAGGGANAVGFYRKSDVAAGETSWTFTTAGATEVAWRVVEMSNIEATAPLDVTSGGSNGSLTSGGTLSTGTTAQNAALSAYIAAGFGTSHSAAAAVSWGSYTNGLVEVADVSSTTATGPSLAVAEDYRDGTTGTFSSTATATVASGTMNASARIVAYMAADAPIATPLSMICGFDWGTHGGMANNTPSNPLGGQLGSNGTFGTNFLIQSGSARNSAYGLRIAVSAGLCGMALGQFSGRTLTFSMNVRVVSATGTVIVAYADAATDLKLVYNASTTKFGLQWGSGTVSYESGTTALNTWRWVDVRLRTDTDVWHADWQIETGTDTYTAQTSPADLTGQTPGQITTLALGINSASQTMTTDYDDIVVSTYYAAFPLGPHEVPVLVPTTTGASVVGTSTNFSEFTANGTLAAFASTSGQRIDEVPPTISASSDGVVQTAVAASDYMKFPMTDPTLASDEVFGAARAVIPAWGGTGTGTGTLWLAVSDGVTETVIDAGTTAYDGDSLTAASGTYPLWRTGMITPPAGGWTATKANALEARVGKSSDATPDMGVSAFYIEYARRKAITARQVTVEDPISATADIRVNPYSSASVSYVVTNNDATRSVNFNYSVSGTPQTPVTVSPSTNQTVTVTADSFGDISDVSLEVI